MGTAHGCASQIAVKSAGRPSARRSVGARSPGPSSTKRRPSVSEAICRMTVADVSGISSLPLGSSARSGNDNAMAKAARFVSTIGAPVWKAIQERAAVEAGSSHSGVSWSIRVNSTPAAALHNGAGADTPRTVRTSPGRAIASSTARKQTWASVIGSAKPEARSVLMSAPRSASSALRRIQRGLPRLFETWRCALRFADVPMVPRRGVQWYPRDRDPA